MEKIFEQDLNKTDKALASKMLTCENCELLIDGRLCTAVLYENLGMTTIRLPKGSKGISRTKPHIKKRNYIKIAEPYCHFCLSHSVLVLKSFHEKLDLINKFQDEKCHIK